METLLSYLPIAVVIILIITGLAEMFVSVTWRDLYFKTGVLIVNKCIPVDLHHTNIPSRDLLEKRFRSNWFSLIRSLKFKELDTNTYAFREGLIARSMSLVHGIVIFDGENHQVSVKGFFNWTLLCFWLMWLIIPPLAWLSGFLQFYDPPGFVVLIYLVITFGNLGISYLMDYARLSAVAEFAARSWARKYDPENRG